MGRPPKADETKIVLDEVLKTLQAVQSRLDALEKPGSRELPVMPVTETIPERATLTESEFPVPFEYRETVETILNKEFGIDIEYQTDTSAFVFTIQVPQKYSNAGAPHWETYKEDNRSKVIPNALGLNGVREWTQKVYENLTPEVKAMIAANR